MVYKAGEDKKQVMEIGCKVSCIVPIYGVEEHLEQCIQSLVNQTEQDIEIILVDDGSPDGCGEICERYRKKDCRIKVIHQDNQGVSVARNVGISNANGTWIMFVDGDDYIEENMIEVMLSYAELRNPDILICDYILNREKVRSEELILPFGRKEYTDTKQELYECAICPAAYNFRSSANVGVPWGKLYKRAFIDSNNLFFVSGLKRMQDTVFNLYAFSYAKLICYEPVALYNYRVWSDSAVNKYNPNFLDVANRILQELDMFMGKNEQSNFRLYSAKAVGLFIETVKLQYVHKDNRSSITTKVKEIKRIAEDIPFRDAFISCDEALLTFTQKIAVKIIRLRLYFLLYLLILFRCKLIKA